MVVVSSMNDAIKIAWEYSLTGWCTHHRKVAPFFRLKTFLSFQSIKHWILHTPNSKFTFYTISSQCSAAFFVLFCMKNLHRIMFACWWWNVFIHRKKNEWTIFHLNEKLHSLPWIWTFICWDSKRHTSCVLYSSSSRKESFVSYSFLLPSLKQSHTVMSWYF